MSERLQERECDRCNLIQLFEVGYEGPDYSVGLSGGWWAELVGLDNNQAIIETDWTIDEVCHCTFTDKEREVLKNEVAKDYGIGWEPILGESE